MQEGKGCVPLPLGSHLEPSPTCCKEKEREKERRQWRTKPGGEEAKRGEKLCKGGGMKTKQQVDRGGGGGVLQEVRNGLHV